MAIPATLLKGSQITPESDPTDARRKHPFNRLQVADFFLFPLEQLPTIRSCANAFARRHKVSFSVGRHHASTEHGVCVRLT
jgi:hypothetical protein